MYRGEGSKTETRAAGATPLAQANFQHEPVRPETGPPEARLSRKEPAVATFGQRTPLDHVEHILNPPLKDVRSRFLREQSERLGHPTAVYNYQNEEPRRT